MSTLQAAGNALTIVGLLVAIGAVTVEARSRHLLIVNRPALVLWARRVLRLSTDVRITGAMASGTFNVSMSATGFAQHTIDPHAPVPEQIAKLQENLDHTRDHVLEVMRAHRAEDRERYDKRLIEHDTQLRELRQEHERTRADERRIATGVARWEFLGLLMALVGALLSTIGSLT